jgi:hypothetical protein
MIAAMAGSAADSASAAEPAPRSASASASDSSKAVRRPRRRTVRRHGGGVRKAWPMRGAAGRPRNALARWLAKQVGPRTPRRIAGKAAIPVAGAAAAAGAGGERVVLSTAGEGQPLQLVRSYEIPSDDPSYDRLLNVSWTYDSAVAAIGFIAAGERAQAERLLDQLSALRRSDGSLEFAWDVYTGAGAPLFRSGTMAWVGLAASTYKRVYGSTRYDSLAHAVAGWLLARRVTTQSDRAYGLLRGGPDVSWISAQHNLIAYPFLRDFGDLTGTASYKNAAKDISKGLRARLLVSPGEGSQKWFMQGYDDDVRALDAQTLGALFLTSQNDSQAGKVADFLQSNFFVSGRSVAISRSTATWNATYSSPGPFQGFRPYSGAGTPDVLWMEGTAQARLVLARLGRSTAALDESLANWWRMTLPAGRGPLGADRTVTVPGLNEYHVWPTSAAASWTLLAFSRPERFYAAG